MDNNKKTYQTLFDIKFNNKFFTIFVDENNRKTFLEIDKNGKYIYPALEDFIILHRIYNERNIFISYGFGHSSPIYDRIPDHSKSKKVTFKEYVIATTGLTSYLIAVVLFANSLAGVVTGKQFKLSYNEHNIHITTGYVTEALIENTEELTHILNYEKISKDDVINAINSNDNLNDYYKQEITIFFEHMVSKYPNTDIRIFYENVKTLKIDIVEKCCDGKAAGCYYVQTNTINIAQGYSDNKEVLYHELAHSYHDLYVPGMMPKYRVETFGYSLSEAMTNRMIEGLVETPYSYKDEGRVLNYLSSNVSYDYIDYEKGGIQKLIELLKNKYPNVDINYIITSLDCMKDTKINTNNFISLAENRNLLDELFNICISNIDLNDKTIGVYNPYIEFNKLLGNSLLTEEYLSKYNDILLNNGYSDDEIIKGDFENNIFALNFFIKYIDQLNNVYITEEDMYENLRILMKINNQLMLPQKSFSKLIILEVIDRYNEFLRQKGFDEAEIISSAEIESELDKYKGIEDFENVNVDISIPIETLFDNFEVVVTQNDDNIDFRVIVRNDKTENDGTHISLRDYIQPYVKNNADSKSIKLSEILNTDYFNKFLLDSKSIVIR